ncbi:sensor histidine kinase [Pacificibacter marinus]|uniref:C4-dicarboxylate transport sensor protein DctB n=1 Tax=Pacificibacter marinus TaxID=658057 RepID=A0A1Y5RUE0_9RHOB|nr:ATP-binding protein [Pacificibacter marinus]SEK38767.1 two-component system, NtrC family, C4-dicarboxylate transport sensor histidine kinase DctB [Pacificibacter marinus]SLN25728.1 C4-dicarboxylate transport sensor protein DctB [Pacificibacter marinus]
MQDRSLALPPQPSTRPRTLTWGGRLALVAFVVAAISVVWVTNLLLTERHTILTRNRAEVRQALYSGNLLSEIQRNSIVPILLSRDPVLVSALNTDDYAQTSQHLISYIEEIGAAGIFLLDESGRVVAATDRSFLGSNRRQSPSFIDALRSNETLFNTTQNESGGYQFTYSRKIEVSGALAGVIVVQVDLAKFEQSWSGISDAVIVMNSEGQIILSTEPRWRSKTEAQALSVTDAPTAIERAFRLTSDWNAIPGEAYLGGEAVMRLESRLPFRGWRMASFTTYSSVREPVNGVLALEIMGFAILLAGVFYLTSRRAMSRAGLFQQESAGLRQLNAALQREIAERKRAERSLEVAEQTLLQSSKLAILGEMSAAVSHELNQPLAAMKTYLAGAKLLLQRKRPDEALASFGRIDDLIDRMGAITRQLKSYARKGSDSLEPIDLRDCVASALSMMEPQLRQRSVEITRTLPPEPVIVQGDRVRLEQVLVNLLRNAFDASKNVADPQIGILVSGGAQASVLVRDNGAGIEDLDTLFEPFYTTKAPGDGVGLGLAISSGIVNELGGRLTARNWSAGGAEFEMILPISQEGSLAAQ